LWLLHLSMLKRSLIFIHRWLGVALCVIFLLWFPSGIGMMYWRFPTVTPEDRLERSPKLDPSKVVLSPIEAAAKVGIQPEPAQVRLNTFDGRPVYRFGGRGQGNDVQIVYADTGEEQIEVPQSMLDRAASAWTGQPVSAATVRPVEEVDQWTVQGQFRNLPPLWKYSWPNGEKVYVSEATGEVVQYTTTASRIGAYLGPIPHWLYFTPLRKHGPTWSQLVIWSSAIGTFSALAGVIIAIWMYSPSKQYRYSGAPSSIPYRGQKRWHMVLGLIFGIATATWAFSGMLSMDPFPRSAPRGAGRRGVGSVAAALRGRVEMNDFARRHPRDLLRQVANLPIKELEFTSFAGEAMYAAKLGDGRTQMISLAGETIAGFDHQRIVDIVKRAAPDANAVETPPRSVRSLLSGSRASSPAAGRSGADERRRADPLLHRPQNRARSWRLQQPELGRSLALQRPPLARLSLVVQLPPVVGHRRHCLHVGRDRTVCDLARPLVESHRTQAQTVDVA
jgi:hypothetical protein